MDKVGITNEELTYNFFKSRISNDFGIFGLMGNLYAESGINPFNLQNTFNTKLGMTDTQYTIAVDNGSYTNFIKDSAGYGIAQWTYWSRKQAMFQYHKSKGKSIGDLETQLEFLYKELSENYKGVLSSLKTAKSILEASNVVLTQFEKPANQGVSVQQKRAEYGQQVSNRLNLKKEETKMSNSNLVSYTKLSPNHSGQRTHSIDRISPHCVVGQLSCETICDCFPAGREASCNYGIGSDGRISLCVEEKNRSWCTSSSANDQRAVTIECASDKTEPYTMNDKVFNSLINLCEDICKRNGKSKLLWFADKDKSLNYEPKSNEMVITVHRWFANKSCPGNWLYERLDDLADKVTSRLGGNSSTPNTPTDNNGGKILYRVQTGAFSNKANANNLVSTLKSAGFETCIVQVNGLYKVQVGAYSEKKNAENQMAVLKSKGFEAFITTQSSGSGTSNIPKKTSAEIAKEIYSGKCSDTRWSSWGNEPIRSQRLKQAGYDPKVVQAEINKLF